MAKTNPFLQSPFQALIDKQAEPIQLPGSDLVTDVEVPDLSEAPEQPASQVAQPAAPVPKKAKAKPASLIPPADLMPVFSASASHFGVPENVLMAIAQQESSYDPDAVNTESGASGIVQYMDATAKSLGINRHDPNEAIPAAAMQIAERLAKGTSLEDAVMEHFAGPDRKKWGEKTRAYGKSVLEKAEAIGRELYKDMPSEAPAEAAPAVTADSTPLPNFGVAPEALKRIQAQWNAATPDERKQMEAIRGPRGYIARELNKRHPAKQPAANPLGLDIDPMSQVNEAYKNPTLDSIDPRAEARARNLVNQGMEGNTANKVARAAALAGMTPGTEPGIGQRIENTDFDFATRKKYQEDPFFSNPAVRGAVKGYEGYKRGILGLNQMAAEVLGADNLAGSLSEAGAESRESEAAMGEADTYGQRMFEGAVSSIAQQVPALIGGAATGSEALVLGTMFAQTFGSEYSEGRARGQNEEQAMGRAALYGTFEVVGEKLGLGDTLRGLRGAVDGATTKDVATSMARALLKEIPGEQLTTLGQFGTDQLGGGYGLNTEAGLAEYLQQAADTAVQTVIQGGIMGGVTTGAAAVGNRIAGPRPAQTGAQAPSVPLDAGPEGRVEPVMGDTPAEPQQVAPSGPLTAALSEAAGVTEEDGFTAQVMGDDGQMYTVDSRAGVVAPAEEVAAGPLESALMEAAELHDADPAPMPAMPEPEPQAPDYTAMPVEELKTQVQQLAAQDKQATDPEQRKKIRAERKTVEKEIGARAKQAQADSKPAEEPMSMGPFDDIKTANKMMMRYAEKTSVPHEVVEKDGKFRIQPLEASDGLDTAGASGRDDGRGRSGELAAGVGVPDGAGRAGTGTVPIGESGVPAGERGNHASVNRVVADEAANPDSAVARNPYAAYSASKPEFAESYMDKRGVDRSKYEVQQTGPVRWQIVPRAVQDPIATTQMEEVADVSERQEVRQEAQAPSGAQSTEQAGAGDRAESADAGAGAATAPAKPKRKVNESVARRQAANAKQDEAVAKAAASLAARSAKKAAKSKPMQRHEVAIIKTKGERTTDVEKTVAALPPVADGHVRLYRAESPTVKFEDVFDVEGLDDFKTDRPGARYTPDLKYADYYRLSYGKDATIHYIDVPQEVAEQGKLDDSEYVIDTAEQPQQAAVEQPPAPIQQEAKPKRKPAAKKKAEPVEEAEGVRYSVSGDVTDSPAFRVWFGDSKVVDEQGRPLVVYHGTHADITQFKKTKGAHLGFHFGDQEAANTRLEDTSDSRIDKEEVARINARAEAFFNELKTFENHLQHKTPEIPQDELLAALEAGEDVGAIFDRYKYKPTNEEAAELDRLQRQYKAAQLPIMKTGIGSNIGAYFLAIRRPLRMPDVGHWGSVKEVRAALPWNSEARSIAQVVEEIKSRGYDGIVYKNRVENPVMQTDSYIAFEPEQIKSAIGNNGEFNPNNPDIRYSADESDTDYSLLDLPMLADSLPVLDSFVETLASAGIIKLHANASTLPVKGKVPQGVQALTTADGKIHVVANALNGNAKGVVLHEAFHAGVKGLVGSKVWRDLMQRLGALYKQGQSTSGAANAFWKAARQRVKVAQLKGAVAEGMEAEEFGAYAIEEYATAPLTVKKWVDDLIGAIKAWVLRRFGAQLGKVTPAQLMALAKVALLDVAQSRQQEAFSTKRTSDIVVDEELLDVAKAETADLPIMRLEIDVERDQQGVIPGKPTSINESLKRGRYTIEQMSDAWSRTRAMLRERYGDTVTLYRADAPQHEWHEDTQVVYMGDEKLARRFVDSERKMQAFNVPVDDIIGVNALSNGYYEFIVKRQDGSAKFSVDRRTEDRGTADRRKTIEFQGQRRPIENSKGQLIAEDMNKQLAFYRWFKDSAVVDEQQRPLVVYHGTNADFSKFNEGEDGIFFSSNPNISNEYAQWRVDDFDGEATVYPVYLSLNNPLIVEDMRSFSADAFQEAIESARDEGRDGVIFRNVKDGWTDKNAGDSFVVFRPEQIKSAVGNSGEFSESNPDIRFSVSGSLPAGAASPAQANAQPQDRTLTPPEQGLLRRVQAQIQDGMNRVKQVQERITALTGVKDFGGADVYRAETNRPGRIAARKEDGRDKLIEPMMKRLAKAGYTPAQLSELLHAQHAEERNTAVAAINPEFPDGGSGLTNAQAQEILDRYEGEAALLALADEARNIARSTLDLKLAYGLITQTQYDTLAISYDSYVPLKGDGEYGPKVKRAMGHEEREEHILENIARDYEQAIVVGEKNLARQPLLQLVLQHPDDSLWTARVPPKGRYVAGTVFNISRKGSTDIEASFTSQSQVAAWLEAMGAAASQYEVNTSGGEQVVEFTKPLQDNEVMVYVKGDPVRIQLHDEKLARQLRPLKSEQMNAVLELMRKHNRYLSMIFTGYNPAFIIKNASRDAITGTINMTGNHGVATAAKAWAKYPMAWATMLKWAATKKVPDTAMGRMLTEYRAQGGKVGASYMSDLEEQGKSLQRMFDDAKGVKGYAAEGKVGKAAWIAARKAVGGAAHAVEIVNQAFENALRLALFAQLRAEGKKPGVAAAAAKSVTVNFDRKGAMTAQMGAFYLFINPAIQGTANATITLTKGEHKYQAWALTGMMAAAGFGMAAMGMDDDKDRWLGEKWDTRTKNLRLRVGETTINIPMSQEFAPFYAIGVAMGEVARGESTMKAAANVMTSFLDAYYPMQGAVQPDSDNPSLDLLLAHIPTVGKAAAQIATNRNSFGSKVVPETDNTKNRPDNLKMSRSTKGSVYDKAAQAIASGKPYENDLSKVSPETIKLLWSTYTGGLGRFVADTVGAGNLARQADVDMDVSDVPIVKDFVKPDNVNAIRSRFYDLSDEAKKTVDEFNAAKKALDGDAMREITSDHVKKAHIGLARMVKSINEVQAIHAEQAVAINADKKLNDADKRARLKQLEAEQEAIYRKAIQAFQQ